MLHRHGSAQQPLLDLPHRLAGAQRHGLQAVPGRLLADQRQRRRRVHSLPAAYRPDPLTYRANLAILEASLAGDPRVTDAALVHPTEPLDERVLGVDLDRDGHLSPETGVLRGLPAHYIGVDEPVRRGLYPEGAELLHSVRYLDPDRPELLAARMKELRYMKKVQALDRWAMQAAYAQEQDNRDEGRLPRPRGSAELGLRGDLGWQLPDAPQIGHEDGEILTYFRRVGAGDELRQNSELLARYFPGGRLDEARMRAAVDLAELLTPSRERALALAKAYRAVVREQSYTRGRDAVLRPVEHVHRRIDPDSTPTAGAAPGGLMLDLARTDLDLFRAWAWSLPRVVGERAGVYP